MIVCTRSKAINGETAWRDTPLGVALLWTPNREMVDLLLERGADRRGKSDLFFAAALGEIDEVKRLLDEDSSDLNMPETQWNATPFDVSVYCGRREVSELLLARGADRRSMTAIYETAALGKTEELALLLAEDTTDIDTPSDYMLQATALVAGGGLAAGAHLMYLDVQSAAGWP